jgi:hypothetical protein
MGDGHDGCLAFYRVYAGVDAVAAARARVLIISVEFAGTPGCVVIIPVL